MTAHSVWMNFLPTSTQPTLIGGHGYILTGSIVTMMATLFVALSAPTRSLPGLLTLPSLPRLQLHRLLRSHHLGNRSLLIPRHRLRLYLALSVPYPCPLVCRLTPRAMPLVVVVVDPLVAVVVDPLVGVALAASLHMAHLAVVSLALMVAVVVDPLVAVVVDPLVAVVVDPLVVEVVVVALWRSLRFCSAPTSSPALDSQT